MSDLIYKLNFYPFDFNTRMEDSDSDSEWEIEEYHGASKEGRMRWILKEGFGMGKQVVLSGIAVSFAPLVVPPLVVTWAMGVAFWVPVGLVFVSYACTNKLISKLFPTPTSSFMLEYYADEETCRGNVIWEEEKEHIKQGVEGNDDDDDDDDDKGKKETGSDMNVVEKGDYWEQDEEEKEGEDDEIKLVQEEEEEEKEEMEQGVELDEEYRQRKEASISNADEEKNVDEKGYYTDDEDEDEEEDEVLTRENVMEKEKEQMEERVELEVGRQKETNFDEGEYVVGDDDDIAEGEVDGLKVVASEIKGQEEEEEEEEIVGGLLEKIRDGGKIDGESGSHGHCDGEQVKITVKEVDSQKLLLKDASKEEEKMLNNDDYENAILKQQLIHSNAAAADESGLDLFDDAAGNDDDKVDVLVPPAAFTQLPLDSDNAKVTDEKMPSWEEYLDEEKIWEQIGAMRAIVGYKAPRQPTYIGELEALYLFTGVEPQVSLKGDLDLDEVNDKLKFLMSIVGVK